MLEGLASKLKMPMKSASVKGPASEDEALDSVFGSKPDADAMDEKVLLKDASVEQLKMALEKAEAAEEGAEDEMAIDAADEDSDSDYA